MPIVPLRQEGRAFPLFKCHRKVVHSTEIGFQEVTISLVVSRCSSIRSVDLSSGIDMENPNVQMSVLTDQRGAVSIMIG